MYKKSELITVVLFCLTLAILTVSFIVIPDKAFSEQENRDLEQMPQLDIEGVFEKEGEEKLDYFYQELDGFMDSINVYYADQFPLRDIFVRLKSGSELALLKGENNGVLYSRNQLAVKDFNAYKSIVHITEETDRIYLDSLKAQLGSVDALAEKLSVPLVTVLPPRTVDIADSAFAYDRPDGDKPFELMQGLSEKAGYIDTLSLLRPKYESGEYVYYRTDHHWTTAGAYYTYCEIMKKLGKEDKIIPRESFEIEIIEGFSGTTAAKAGFPIYQRDELELWHLSDDGEYEITADDIALDGFYNRDFLSKSDKYSVFLDGTHDFTEIKKKGDSERETLLVAKDSFANCLIPFLAREYDIIAVNLATNTLLSAFAENYGADAVLIVFNTENIITTGHLGNLR